MDRSEERKYRRAETAVITAKLKVAEKVLEHWDTLETLRGLSDESKVDEVADSIDEIGDQLKHWHAASEKFADLVSDIVKRGSR